MKTSKVGSSKSGKHNGNHVDLSVDVPVHIARRIRQDAKRRGVDVGLVVSEAIHGLFEASSHPNRAAGSISAKLDPDVAALSRAVAKSRGVDVDIVLKQALRDGIDAARKPGAPTAGLQQRK